MRNKSFFGLFVIISYVVSFQVKIGSVSETGQLVSLERIIVLKVNRFFGIMGQVFFGRVQLVDALFFDADFFKPIFLSPPPIC